jgi:glycosyltransferase involved in cell wall biosynthesis
MKVGIDASRYKIKEPTGVEWYSYHLLNYLIPLLGTNHELEVILYTQQKTAFEAELPFNVREKVIAQKRLWTMLRLSWEMLIRPIDMLFIPSHILPIFLPKKTIVTVHDIAFKIPGFEKIYDWKNRFLLEWSTRRAVKKAYKIIVPSEATKKDLIEIFGCKADKINVIAHGGPDITGENNPLLKKWKIEESAKNLQRLGLNDADLCILYVGRIEFKKNLVKLVEGFSRFLKEYPGWKLVLAGKNGLGAEEVKAKVSELNLGEAVVFTGYISEEEKRFLLNKCRVFAFPSKYEGFGLPILEAFAYRRPVLTSKVSSMPEVAGKAAFLVDPDNVAEISVGLKRLVADGILISKLINEGDQQLQKFDWEKAARQTLDIINS